MDDATIKRELEIRNRLGLHARAAAQLVQTAARFASSVSIAREGQTVDGKSILGVLMLGAGFGSRIEVSVVGADAAEAMAAIEALVDQKFNED